MKIEKEQQFLKIIKFTPSIFVIVISLFVILFLYFENKSTFNQEKKDIEEKNTQAEISTDEKIQESVKIYEICINMQVKKKAELSNLYLSDDKFFHLIYNNDSYN